MAPRTKPTPQPCRDCGNTPRTMAYPDSGFELFCRECCTNTGEKRTLTMAINYWNRTYGKKQKKVKR